MESILRDALYYGASKIVSDKNQAAVMDVIAVANNRTVKACAGKEVRRSAFDDQLRSQISQLLATGAYGYYVKNFFERRGIKPWPTPSTTKEKAA